MTHRKNGLENRLMNGIKNRFLKEKSKIIVLYNFLRPVAVAYLWNHYSFVPLFLLKFRLSEAFFKCVSPVFFKDFC